MSEYTKSSAGEKVEGNDQIKFPAPLRLRRDELNTIFEYRVGEAKPEIGEDSIK